MHFFFIKSYEQKLWIGLNFSGDQISPEDATYMFDFCEPIYKAINLKSGVCHENFSVKRSPLKTALGFKRSLQSF